MSCPGGELAIKEVCDAGTAVEFLPVAAANGSRYRLFEVICSLVLKAIRNRLVAGAKCKGHQHISATREMYFYTVLYAAQPSHLFLQMA